MKCLFVIIGVIPVAKRFELFKKKMKFNFPEATEASEEEMDLIRPIIEKGEKKV